MAARPRDLFGGSHEAGEDGFFAAGEAHDDVAAVGVGLHAEEWAAGPADGDGLVGVAVEDGAGGLGDVGLDDGAGGVEAGAGGCRRRFWG